MKLRKKIVVFFHGDADTGKTTTLKRLAEILREKSIEYREVKNSSRSTDKLVVAKYKDDVVVGIGTSGDLPDLISGNLEFFEKHECDISFTAARYEHASTNYARDKRLIINMAKFSCVDVARNQASKKYKQFNVNLVREDDLFLYLLAMIRKNKVVPFHLGQ